MTKFWGIFFLAAWISGQIVRLPGEFPVTVLDVAVGGMAIGEMIKKIKRSRDGEENGEKRFDKRINGQTDKLINGIILALAASWVLGLRLFSWQESIPGGLYLLRFLGYVWVIANAGKLLAPVKKFIIPAFWIFIILAWAQYLFLPDTRFLLELGWDEHYYRMIGTVLDPNYLGVMLGVIAVYLVEEEKKAKKQKDWEKIWKRSNVWLAVLALSGLVVTYSRASWIAVMVVGCWLLVISGGFRGRLGKLGVLGILSRRAGSCFAGGFLLLILTVWLITPKPGGEGVNLWRTNSIEQRIVSWEEGVEIWREHPWAGVGFNNYKEYKESKDKERWGKEEKKKWEQKINHAGNAPSSSWILLLATIGIIGLGWLSMAGWLAVRNINRFWIGILVMVGIHAVFNNTMFYPPVLGLLALIKAANEE